MEWFASLSPVIQALLATIFTWGVTALGAAVVLFFKNINKRLLDGMLGFGAGVMIAASFWSLLNPALELAEDLGSHFVWFTPALGFLAGGLFVVLSEKLMDHFYFNQWRDAEGKNSLKRSLLLVSAVTIHNIPEGLAVGVAFGGVVAGIEGATLISAILLAIGIGLQNFPEGAAVSLPLRREGYSRWKSFPSGLVEPVAGVIGALAAISVRSLLPFLLAFAAGAMISVVSSELIPESARDNKNLAAIGVILGFMVMMVMDVALG